MDAGGVWRRIAEASGLALRVRGPLARYVAVADWRRLCVECLGPVHRELRGEGAEQPKGRRAHRRAESLIKVHAWHHTAALYAKP